MSENVVTPEPVKAPHRVIVVPGATWEKSLGAVKDAAVVATTVSEFVLEDPVGAGREQAPACHHKVGRLEASKAASHTDSTGDGRVALLKVDTALVQDESLMEKPYTYIVTISTLLAAEVAVSLAHNFRSLLLKVEVSKV
jgi:hypothetical protein